MQLSHTVITKAEILFKALYLLLPIELSFLITLWEKKYVKPGILKDAKIVI